MTPAYWAYVPKSQDLAHITIAWLIALLLGGAASCLRLRAARDRPEMAVLLGWGVFCLLATAWAVVTPFTLLPPAAAFAMVGLIGLFFCREWRWLGILALLSLPLWLIMAPVRPAEPDTWLNLLPNADYLVDYGRFPVNGAPDSHSFLPAAPYNTQFVAYLGGLLDPSYPAGGLSLDNVLLLVIAAAVTARALAADARPGWALGAFGILLVTLFNPGFVPRIHLAAYGETGLAVTALAAAVLFAEGQGRALGRDTVFHEGLAIGLVLAAMINVKQSGFGLVAALAGAAVITGFAESVGAGGKALRIAVVALISPLALFLLWRWFVAHAGVDELRPLPFAAWQWRNIPTILASMAQGVAQKGVYFGCVGVSLAILPFALKRMGWRFTTRLLAFNAALTFLYTGFLLLTYIGHFPGAWSTEAHSFFRYETHLSLVLVLTLAMTASELLAASTWPAGENVAAWRGLAIACVALAAVSPFAFARFLRFDLDMPQPLVWDMAENLAPLLADDSRLALLLPSDNGSVATMLQGVLRDTAPRRPALDILAFNHADDAALERAAKSGYALAFVSCTTAPLAGVAAGKSALYTFAGDSWRPRQVWEYPPDAGTRWQHVLAWPPLCRTS